MIVFVGQRVAGEYEGSRIGLFIIALTPQPPLSGGLRRRCLVSLWYSRFPPDKVPALSLSKGGKGG